MLLVAPLSDGHIEQPGKDQHKRSVAIRENIRYTGMATNLPVELLNDIVSSNPSLVPRRRIATGQSFINVVLHFLVASCCVISRSC